MLLEEFLLNERKIRDKKVNFKAFSLNQISISEGIYGTQRLGRLALNQVEDLIGKQKVINYTRIANAMKKNIQDLNFICKNEIDCEKLASLASTESNWLDIANILNSGHTAIQIFKYYKKFIKPNVKASEFTNDEERLLQRGNFLYQNNCAAIATLLPGRDLNQIYSKRKYFMKKVGKWGKDEDKRLLEGIQMHGTDWNSVAVFMQTRNPDQCRNRYINNLDPTLDHSKLTIDEKKKVLELVDKLGVKKLKEVASHFPTRSPQMITNCYKVHQRKQKKDATRI